VLKKTQSEPNAGPLSKRSFVGIADQVSQSSDRSNSASSFSQSDILDVQVDSFGDSVSRIESSAMMDSISENRELPTRILRFSVKDYGTGIEKKDFARIFKPFKQANCYTEQLYGGTGLGLAITSKLVKGLGGNISVDSVKGEWSEFTVDFPFGEPPSDVTRSLEDLQAITVLSVSNSADATYVENNVFDRNQINYVKFSDMNDMLKAMDRNGGIDSDRYYICLIQEDLYRPEVYERLSRISKSTLLTFGPQYCVKETNRHIRSLSQLLPSVLIQVLCDHVKSSIAKSKGMESTESADPHPIACNEIKVLIAEDNTINQKVLNRMLIRLGVEKVDIVDNGLKAVDLESQKKDYDIVFMDMQMPVMNGIEACKHIVKRRGSSARPKVVFVTANVCGGYESEAQDAGADGFISKPFNIKEIGKSFNLLR
jgi:CheY-like chemotaxis protein